MTRTEYRQYKSAVSDFLTTNDVKPGCFIATDTDGDSFFSHSPCTCCRRTLAGTRREYTFATNHGESFEADICSDCEYYLTYGRLDDQTMLDLQEDESTDSTEDTDSKQSSPSELTAKFIILPYDGYSWRLFMTAYTQDGNRVYTRVAYLHLCNLVRTVQSWHNALNTYKPEDDPHNTDTLYKELSS